MVGDEVQDLLWEGERLVRDRTAGKLHGSERALEALQTMRGGRMGVRSALIGPA